VQLEYIPIPKPLAKNLWLIRQRVVASGMQLLNEAEIEQELGEHRGGQRESKKVYIDSNIIITLVTGKNYN
jgi:hypothetical protein